MSFLDFSSSSLSVRILAALISIVACGGIAAMVVMFSMMMILFSADSGATPEASQRIDKMLPVIAISLAVAVLMPAVLVVLRVPSPYCYLPAGCGLIVAGAGTLLIVMANLQ